MRAAAAALAAAVRHDPGTREVLLQDAFVTEVEELDAGRLEAWPDDAEQQMTSWDRLLEPHRA